MIPEFELIEEIRQRFAPPAGVQIGIGDDAAVLAERFDVVTTDVLVESVHFRCDWSSPEDIGWRAVVASLSDVAAMGARPGPFVVSLCLGPTHDEGFARGLLEGIQSACEWADASDVGPVGGDLSSSPGPAVVSVTLFGRLEGADPIRRSSASVGDRVVLLGTPGRSAAGLEALQRIGPELAESRYPSLVDAYCRPTAQLDAGRAIGHRGLASAMIDVSDGLVNDLGHILEASGVGARLELGGIPISDDLQTYAKQADSPAVDYALSGGEDFSLLATVAAEDLDEVERLADRSGWPMSAIGAIVPSDQGFTLVAESGEVRKATSEGYQHFD